MDEEEFGLEDDELVETNENIAVVEHLDELVVSSDVVVEPVAEVVSNQSSIPGPVTASAPAPAPAPAPVPAASKIASPTLKPSSAPATVQTAAEGKSTTHASGASSVSSVEKTIKSSGDVSMADKIAQRMARFGTQMSEEQKKKIREFRFSNSKKEEEPKPNKTQPVQEKGSSKPVSGISERPPVDEEARRRRMEKFGTATVQDKIEERKRKFGTQTMEDQ